MQKTTIYRFFRIFHITGLITWLGPSSGAFYLIIKSNLEGKPTIELWLRSTYIDLLYLEAFALIFMILTGLGMVASKGGDLLGAKWLRIKIAIVGIVFIPMETIQLYLYKFLLIPAIHTNKGLKDAISTLNYFNIIAIIILLLTLPLVFFLAIFKPCYKH